MAEMIIPGTYIDVRAEGLIAAGRIATGVVGVVGTAASGPVGEATVLSGFGDAHDQFGSVDDFDQPADGANPLTLVRAIQQVYNNGATTVIAVRVAGPSASSATFELVDKDGRSTASLAAMTPGTWGNQIKVVTDAADADCLISGETVTSGFTNLSYAPVVAAKQNQIRIARGATKRTETLDIVYKMVVSNEQVVAQANKFVLGNTPIEAVAGVNQVQVLDASGKLVRAYGDGAILYGAGGAPVAGQIRIDNATGAITFEATQVPSASQKVVATYGVGHADPQPGQVLITTWDATIAFAAGQAPKQADGDTLLASYLVARGSCVKLTLQYGPISESYVAPDGKTLAQMIDDRSGLASAKPGAVAAGSTPMSGADATFGTGSNTPGNDGADAGADDYAAGLDTFANEIVNIVVLAGQDARAMGSVLVAHLKQTAETDYERIGVIGSFGTDIGGYIGHDNDAAVDVDGRVVLVAPGIAQPDGSVLPAPYTAAAVAGLISSLDPQTSLTNKPLNVPGLSAIANRGQQAQLIGANVLAVVRKEGFRVLKGITTAGEGTPFSAIPTRRIVDYARYGVRSAANPYIGRLNNDRVRSALKATVDAFLTRMVQDEQLTGYELEVTATRAQEIAGEVSVVMTLQPTFSIDFIKVTMILR